MMPLAFALRYTLMDFRWLRLFFTPDALAATIDYAAAVFAAAAICYAIFMSLRHAI